MKLHRFIGQYDLSKKEVEITDIATIKQIRGVLRLEAGAMLILSDGKGKEAQAMIKMINKNQVLVEIMEVNTVDQIKRKVSLYLAILKKENFELAVQKATECGVSEIIPVITERTVKTGLNTERLNKIIREASEQSGRNILPTLSPILKFEDAILDGKKNVENIFFDLEIQENKEHANKGGGDASALGISIFIGPEGGFTKEENNFAKENNYEIKSLGTLTLRGETAAIIATYRAVHAF